ncbi:hypothetical protein ABS71_12250 [bacterium SCN 62-11]|nr:hypothetical protein [Candidatus Eremiobacteraeota bacterium]ODT65357.1 MAG: hypothetical protein ABS71_12250 [bacterium SCN 62-11]
MKIALFLLLLTLTAAARTPAEIVQDVFEYDFQHGMTQTLQDRAHCFTPGFLQLFRKALALPTGGPAFVDMDYFRNGQDSGQVLKTTDTEVHGKEAIVSLKIWQGAYRGAPAGPQPKAPTTRVFLTDLGQGYQIWDIRHSKLSARQDFQTLLKGKWPK